MDKEAEWASMRFAVIDEGLKPCGDAFAMMVGCRTYIVDVGRVMHRDGTITYPSCDLVTDQDIDWKHRVVMDTSGRHSITVRSSEGRDQQYSVYYDDEVVSIKERRA